MCGSEGQAFSGVVACRIGGYEPIIDFGPLSRFQDKEAIPFILEAAENEAVSSERQAYAVLLAAEMSVIHNQDTQPVRRVLRIFEQSDFSSQAAGAFLGGAFALIDKEAGVELPDADEFICRADVLFNSVTKFHQVNTAYLK